MPAARLDGVACDFPVSRFEGDTQIEHAAVPEARIHPSVSKDASNEISQTA
jgi:hypothetical protein